MSARHRPCSRLCRRRIRSGKVIVEHLIGPRVCRDVHLGAALGALPIGLAKPDPIVGILDRLRLRLERVILSPEL